MEKINFKGVAYEALKESYKELINVVGYECAEKLYDYYRGQQLNFPVRLYDADYIARIITNGNDDVNIKQLSRSLGCSERWIRKLAKNEKEKIREEKIREEKIREEK